MDYVVGIKKGYELKWRKSRELCSRNLERKGYELKWRKSRGIV